MGDTLVRKYAVVRHAGFDYCGFHFAAGEVLFQPWIDVPGIMSLHRMEQLRLIAPIGEVDADEVPDFEAFIHEVDQYLQDVAAAEVDDEQDVLEGGVAVPYDADPLGTSPGAGATGGEESDEAARWGRLSGLADAALVPDRFETAQALKTGIERMNIAVASTYALGNMDQLEELIGAELKGKSRKHLLVSLRELLALRPAPPDPLADVETIAEGLARAAATTAGGASDADA